MGETDPAVVAVMTQSPFPLVGGMNGQAGRKAGHCWVKIQPTACKDWRATWLWGICWKGRAIFSWEGFSLGEVLTSRKQRVCLLLYWTANLPIILIKGWGLGTRGNAFIAHLWLGQMCTSKCQFLFLWSHVCKSYGERELLFSSMKMWIQFSFKHLYLLWVP